MTARAPLLSVVVCSYNRAGLLPGCLDSLVGQTLDPSLYEVIVVDNNSTDRTGEIAAGYAELYPNFRVVTEPRQGLSNARNRGWRVACGSLVAYLDDDAKATFSWCEGIVRAFQTVLPRPAAVGGEIRPWYSCAPPRWFSDALEARTWGSHAHFLASSCARYGFSGSNMAFPKEILVGFGGFSAELGMMGGTMALGEETELFTRIYADHPHFWYDPAISVFHLVPPGNMRLGYRFRRSFKCGAAIAQIEGRPRGFRHCLRGAIDVGFVLARAALALPRSGAGFGTEAVRRLEELGGRVGYFFGSI